MENGKALRQLPRKSCSAMAGPSRRQALAQLAALAALAQPARAQNSPAHDRLSREAQQLLNYLQEQRGRSMLAGHHVTYGGRAEQELAYIEQTTEKVPALLEFEAGIFGERFHRYTEQMRDRLFEAAQAHWQAGGLVGLCWHWGHPLERENTYEGTKRRFDLVAARTPGSREQRALLKDLQSMAQLLIRFRDARIPVLWRPLHEMCGGWFWWSMSGREEAQRLWKYLYAYFSDEHDLDNLLWVYSASQELRTDWIPDLSTIDVLGVDIYRPGQQSAREMYEPLVKAGPKLPIALTECDLIPDMESLRAAGFLWSWFTTWHGEYVRRNPPDKLRAIYQHELVVTRDRLPPHANGSKSEGTP